MAPSPQVSPSYPLRQIRAQSENIVCVHVIPNGAAWECTTPYENATCSTRASALKSSSSLRSPTSGVSLHDERAGERGIDRHTLGESRGVRAMLVYLFRDENSRDTFAYSTDVTGRKIPRLSPYSQWSFVAAEKIQDL